MNRLIQLITISLLQLCLVVAATAQDAGDFAATTLDLSRTYPGGTARMQGLGGAQTALGGDISSAYSNPAGLGFFNRSEFSFSPTFNYVSTSSDYLNTTTSDSKLNFNFANLGAVINKSKGDLVDSKWRGGSFGITMNRIADFQNEITYEGNNTQGDFLDFAVDSDNFYGSNDLSDLAFNTYLTDQFYEIYNGQQTITINGREESVSELYGNNLNTGDSLFFVDRNIYAKDNNGNKIPAFPEPDFPTRQSETVSSKGAMYQASFAYGGNYNDQLYLGASVGILSVDRSVERTYIERPTDTDLDNLVITDNYDLSGVGVNATFGVIVRPITPVLIGVTYTTPSYFALEQSRELAMQANFVDENYEDGIDYEPFNYTITTPSRVSGGITYFFGKNGFITADVEHVNYSGGKLAHGSDGYSFGDYNRDIDRYESALNYRVGAEYRFDMFRIRAGYAYLGDPTDDDLDQTESRISFGGGIRTRDYYVDLGVVNSLGRKSTITPYPGAPVAEVTNENTAVTISVGFFF